MATTPLSIPDFAAKVRSTYPGAYDHLSDADLVQKVVTKYPEYKDHIASYAKTDFEKGKVSNEQGGGINLNGAAQAAGDALKNQVSDAFSPKNLIKNAGMNMIDPLQMRSLPAAYDEAKAGWQRGGSTLGKISEAATSGLGSFLGMSGKKAAEHGEKGEGGAIIGEAAVPAVETLAAEGVGRGVPALRRVAGKALYDPVSGAVRNPYEVAMRTIIPDPGEAARGAQQIRSAKAEMEANIAKERQGRAAAHAEMGEDIQKGQLQRVGAREEMNTDIANERQKRAAGHAEMGEDIEREQGKRAAGKAEMESDIANERQSRAAARDEMYNDLASARQRRGVQQGRMDLINERRLSAVEKARQEQLADRGKLEMQDAGEQAAAIKRAQGEQKVTEIEKAKQEAEARRANPEVMHFPEPHGILPADRPGSMWSVPREELTGRALRGQPGAGDVLSNIHQQPILYEPKGAGYGGPRPEPQDFAATHQPLQATVQRVGVKPINGGRPQVEYKGGINEKGVEASMRPISPEDMTTGLSTEIDRMKDTLRNATGRPEAERQQLQQQIDEYQQRLDELRSTKKGK